MSSAKYVTLYQAYVERLQPVITGINRRYPAIAPADFDPYYGESWDTAPAQQGRMTVW